MNFAFRDLKLHRNLLAMIVNKKFNHLALQVHNFLNLRTPLLRDFQVDYVNWIMLVVLGSSKTRNSENGFQCKEFFYANKILSTCLV